MAISFVVYVCSFEGKVFKRGESDDEEEYEFEKEMVVEGLTEFERVEVEKIERLRVTEHGIREIRRLR